MSLQIDLQSETNWPGMPTRRMIFTWANLALAGSHPGYQLYIRLLDEQGSAELNEQYRDKAYATNVLSFPYEGPQLDELKVLGDLLICPPVLAREADNENKPLTAHWAHILIHGCLHLVGYDHIKLEEALIMETKEAELLAELGYPNPYSMQQA